MLNSFGWFFPFGKGPFCERRQKEKPQREQRAEGGQAQGECSQYHENDSRIGYTAGLARLWVRGSKAFPHPPFDKLRAGLRQAQGWPFFMSSDRMALIDRCL